MEGEGISFNLASPVTGRPGSRDPDSGLGIAYMAIGMFMFAAVDAQAKLLTATLHPIQIVWFRQLGLLIGVIVLFAVRGAPILRTPSPVLQIVRGCLAAASAVLYVVAVSFVPLADAVAVAFVAPFIVTVLGAVILREPVGVRRWIAVIIGFAGAMIVIRPGLGVIHPALMLVLLAALFFALRQILSRVLSGSDRTVTTVAYTALVSSLLLTVPMLLVWQWPSTNIEIVLLASIAVLAAFAELLVIKSLEITQAVIVAPVQYSLLIWGTMYGYLIFGQLPDAWTLTGALIIVATGIYTFNRERIIMRDARRGFRQTTGKNSQEVAK